MISSNNSRMAKSCSSDARGTEYRVQFVRAGQKRGRDVGRASKRYRPVYVDGMG